MRPTTHIPESELAPGDEAARADRTDPAILLVDIDAFFAQAEQLRRPELRGRPVIVGGLATDRSVVASASYEARARGIKTAMPLREAQALCPEATFLRGSFPLYQTLSRDLMDVCRRYTPRVEPVSLDEAYLDLAGCWRVLAFRGAAPPGPRWALGVAEHLKQAVREATGLVVSVGVGTSRLVAKIASDYAKPNGVALVDAGAEAAFLAPLPVRALPGIGRRTAERLAQYNLARIGQLAALPPGTLEAQLGPHAEALAARARGEDPRPVRAGAADAKSISRETTFETNLIGRDALEAMLAYLLERCGRHLRSLGRLARTVTVKVRYADFRTVARSRSLPTPSDHDSDFWPVVRELFARVHTRRVGVRLVGVALSNLGQAGRQRDLFDEAARQRRARYYRSVDRIRDRFGFSALVTGRAIDLLETHKRDRHGFKLRTACLSR